MIENKSILCPKTISMALLVTGNLIGAGILALPINTGIAGFYPSFTIMTVLAIAMYFSAVTVSKEIIKEKNPLFNFASFYHNNLGRTGQIIAVATSAFILYGYLIAYITGISLTLIKSFNIPISYNALVSAVTLTMTLFCLKGARLAAKFNFLFMLIVLLSFVTLIFLSSNSIQIDYLARSNWKIGPSVAPIILTAFYFHSIIPNISHELNYSQKKVNTALLIGTIIGFIMCSLWLYVGIGIIPFDTGDYSLIASYQEGLPATVAMTKILNNEKFLFFSLIFIVFAILTSYVANGLGLLGIFKDLSFNHLRIKNKFFPLFLTFIPPYLVAIFFPNLFLKTLDFAGGVGTSILFGLLPFIVVLRKGVTGYKRFLYYFVMGIFAITLLCELTLDLKLIQISPTYDSYEVPFIKKFFTPIGFSD